MEMVNLLPWRERKRNHHRQRFVVAVILSVLVAIIGVQIAAWYVSSQIDVQQARQQYLQKKIDAYQKDIALLSDIVKLHDTLEQRLRYVETLQRQRNKTTAVMNVLPELIPKGVYVDKIVMEGTRFKLSGISSRTANLAQMLDLFERSTLLINVDMHSIVHGNQRFGQSYQSFNISFQFNSARLSEWVPSPSHVVGAR
ncbi:hypothetical protein BCU70_14675 [Vibrio sp. 10N.286.49.C2]|uniref:PilN domain-containing protein n=1 Tax=unclassified Vibrio TaxID=2614977 RepID=UPI000C82CC56|nr:MULTISPECIES: PilN domain-containing protein [unclassified Vibrio]PMH37905.1 hypothetical protein BCU70_14675 [Vibrio sp. 10N.286.49.C2]PMH53163.1 hypothetical protein BCU66_14215 [Vibrio sp. 10N.286.49.B1]PMH84037.1 hypothetical protein BCU58_12650 [Vibrio sp. 10N.286.48.B7]